MACFIAPAAEAVIVSTIKHTHEKNIKSHQAEEHSEQTETFSSKISDHSFSSYLMSKLHRLSTLLWGGSFLLLIEHIWHGEIVPWFPFFTAFKEPDGVMPMLYEIATVGMSMALAVTIAWLIGVFVCYQRDKKQRFLSHTAKEGKKCA